MLGFGYGLGLGLWFGSVFLAVSHPYASTDRAHCVWARHVKPAAKSAKIADGDAAPVSDQFLSWRVEENGKAHADFEYAPRRGLARKVRQQVDLLSTAGATCCGLPTRVIVVGGVMAID